MRIFSRLERGLSDYFEKTAAIYQGDTKKISNWLMNDVLRMINEQNLAPMEMALTPAFLAPAARTGG